MHFYLKLSHNLFKPKWLNVGNQELTVQSALNYNPCSLVMLIKSWDFPKTHFSSFFFLFFSLNQFTATPTPGKPITFPEIYRFINTFVNRWKSPKNTSWSLIIISCCKSRSSQTSSMTNVLLTMWVIHY